MDTILLERRDPILLIQLNRPQKLNAINREMLQEIQAALEDVRADERIRIIVLTGNERAFSVGADIELFASATPATLPTVHSDLHYWETLHHFPKPLIAAVSGYVYGGGLELALACDLIVASDTARFASPEIRLGLIPGAGGTQHLARRLGKYRAMELVLTGREFTAQEALAMGLVTRVVPAGQYLDEALRLAQEIAQHSPAAIRAAKLAIISGPEMSWEAAMRFERELFHLTFSTPEAHEAVRAFLESRRQRRDSSQ